MRKPVTMPINERYRPDVKRFTCTCPQFIISRFLICKHLVQLFHPVNPRFFLEVTRNRSLPFWSHPSLKPISLSREEIEAYQKTATIDDENDEAPGDLYSRVNTAKNEVDDFDFESEDDDALIDTWENGGDDLEKKTYEEEMEDYIDLIRDFCNGLEFQIKFQDRRFLKTLQRDGAKFFQLARNCLSREKRQNSSRVASPTTWERSTANALFYRSRPCRDHTT